jgi:protein gp37
VGNKTKIEWTDATWNPVRGCTRISEGCRLCYAERTAARFSGAGEPYAGLAHIVRRPDGAAEARWTGELTFGHGLDAPLRWRKPRRIFVNSMSDLFHEKLSDEEIATVFGVAVAAHHLRGHTLQILTKRAARMRRTLTSPGFWDQVNAEASTHVINGTDLLDRRRDDARAILGDYGAHGPPPGIWLGVSAENQDAAEERVPELLCTPAIRRFVSAEPLLGPIDFAGLAPSVTAGGEWMDALNPRTWAEEWAAWQASPRAGRNPLASFLEWHGLAEMPAGQMHPVLDQIIVGGESGPGARAADVAWIDAIMGQCERAGTACFVKQLGRRARMLRDDAVYAAARGAGWTADSPGSERGVVTFVNHKGGDPQEWPVRLRVRTGLEMQP